MTIKFEAEIHQTPISVEWEVARYGHESICIVRKLQEDGTHKFGVYDGLRRCLSRTGEWTFESFPSNRPDNWTTTHRFFSLEEAAAVAIPAAEARVKELRERVAFMNEKEAEKDE